MRVFIVPCLLVIAVTASHLEELRSKSQDFKLKHGKTYKNQAEESIRFNIFKDNLRFIEAHNALYEQGLTSYKQGINQFTDLTQQEFKDMRGQSTFKKPHFDTTKYVRTGLAVPDSVDWRTTGQVSEVKDQGNCGSCWAFTVTGATESAYYRKNGNLVSLSEQQLVDCSTDRTYGCRGGYIGGAYPYVQKYGLQSEASYPYTASNTSTCKYDSSAVVTQIDEFVAIPSGDEDALLDAVANVGPISVVMDDTDLSSYQSGIFDSDKCRANSTNHYVLAVGYGSENGQAYWIAKNSWGATWGDHGYFKILRGQNKCGIAMDSGYPIIN